MAPLLALLRLGARPPDPATVAWLAAVPTALASTASIGLVYRLAPRFGLSRRAAMMAAVFYAFHWLPLGYGATPYPRPISTMLFLAALLLVVDASRFQPVLGGFLIGAAFAVRFSEGALLAPFLIVAWRSRRARSTVALGVCGFLIGATVCAGGADLATWGRPFESLAEYFRIMFGSAPPSYPHYEKPWYWYATSALQWAGPAAIVLAALVLKRREARLPAALLGVTLVAFSAVHFKTYRYVQAAVPFVAILMALGWEQMAASPVRWRRMAALALLIAAPAWGVERLINLLRDKSMDAVSAARWIRDRHPRAALLEQGWAYGGILMLGGPDIAIRDLPPRSPLALVPAELDGVSVAAFYARDLTDADRALLRRRGFTKAASFARYRRGVDVFVAEASTSRRRLPLRRPLLPRTGPDRDLDHVAHLGAGRLLELRVDEDEEVSPAVADPAVEGMSVERPADEVTRPDPVRLARDPHRLAPPLLRRVEGHEHRGSLVAVEQLGAELPASHAAHAIRVSLAQDRQVVVEVPGRDVRERADGERSAARRAPPRPRGFGQVAEEGERRVAEGAEFFDVPLPCHRIGLRGAGRGLLVEGSAARPPEPRANHIAR